MRSFAALRMTRSGSASATPQRGPRWPPPAGPANGLPCSARELLAVGLLVGAILLLLYQFGTTRVGLRTDDAGQYFRMAEAPEHLARLPYTFRVLTPLLAGFWPGDPLAGFTALTLATLLLAGVALYAYRRVLDLSRGSSLAGATLFAVSGGAVRLLTTPVYVDPATYLGEAAAFLFLATGRFRPYLATVVLGVLNRETALLLVPLYFVATPPAQRTRVRSVLVLAVPTSALIVVGLVKLSVGGVLGGGVPLAAVAPFARTFRQDVPPLYDLFDLFSTFGALWLLAARNLPGPTRFQRRALVFGALLLAQLAVARGDEGRVLSHLFPLVIPLAMLEVERLLHSRLRHRALLAGLLVLACAASMVHARWTIFEPAALRYAIVAVGTVVALALAIVGARTADRRRPIEGLLQTGPPPTEKATPGQKATPEERRGRKEDT